MVQVVPVDVVVSVNCRLKFQGALEEHSLVVRLARELDTDMYLQRFPQLFVGGGKA